MSDVAGLLFQVAAFNPLEFQLDKKRAMLDLRGWIATPFYFVDSLSGTDAFALSIQDGNSLNIGLTNDVNRFAAAAVESVARIRKDSTSPKHLAWQAVQAYYAAFYAVHSILRLFGRSCSHLEHAHVKRVWENADALGLAGSVSKIESGFYECAIDASAQLVKFSKVKDSHADSWNAFRQLLVDVKNRLPTLHGLSTTKFSTDELIDDLLAVFCQKGCVKGNWLSQYRNGINYRFSHGTWFPFSNRPKIDFDDIERRAREVRSDVFIRTKVAGNDVESAFFACFNCVRLCLILIDAFSERASTVPGQLRRGIYHLLNQTKELKRF